MRPRFSVGFVLFSAETERILHYLLACTYLSNQLISHLDRSIL